MKHWGNNQLKEKHIALLKRQNVVSSSDVSGWLRNSFLHMGHCFVPKQRIGYWFRKSQTTASVTYDSDQSDPRLCECMNVLSSFLIINELTGNNVLKYL